MTRLVDAGLMNAQIKLSFVKCRYCGGETGRLSPSRRYEYDFVHSLCSPMPPNLPDKRPTRSADVRKWLAALLDVKQLEMKI